ncbi:helix-turn-helix domain-containing protein [Haloarculaceae archaeon H-GB2-1]|nr:helix-turn-helix domain-containing protein [Haloarculaceae archaeon H-GB2-1]
MGVHSVFSPPPTTEGDFPELVREDPTVSDAIAYDEMGDGCVYKVGVASGLPILDDAISTLGIRVRSVVSRDDGWGLQLQVPDRAALVRYRKSCVDAGVTFDVDRLSRDAADERPRCSVLTPEQLETVRLAHEMGYFDVPRTTSQQELATVLGVSPSAVSERLRRSLGTLVETELR